MNLKFQAAAGIVFLAFLFLSVPVYAGKKGDAKKQIDSLNQEIAKAVNGGDLQTAIEKAEQAFDLAKQGYGEDGLEAAKAMNAGFVVNRGDYRMDPGGPRMGWI